MSSCAARVHAAAPAHAAAARLRAKHAVPALAAAPSRARRAAPRFRCDAAAGAEVADALDGSSVFLVGMMGTGKSSVGKKLAAELGYNFFDTCVPARRRRRRRRRAHYPSSDKPSVVRRAPPAPRRLLARAAPRVARPRVVHASSTTPSHRPRLTRPLPPLAPPSASSAAATKSSSP